MNQPQQPEDSPQERSAENQPEDQPTEQLANHPEQERTEPVNDPSAVRPTETMSPSLHPTEVIPAEQNYESQPVLPRDQPHLSGPSVFASVRARWLVLFVVVGVVIVFLLESVLSVLLPEDLSTGPLSSALFYVPFLVWAFFIQWRNRVRLRALFSRPRIGKYWWVLLGMLPVLLVFNLGAAVVTSSFFPSYVESAEIDTSTNALALLITVAVIPPIVEELIFRGLLLERWATAWRVGTAVIVQAVFFGVLHVNPIGAGAFGLVLALVYLRSRSLWPPIAMHALWNGFVVLVVLTAGDVAQQTPTPSTGADLLGQILVGLVMMAVAAPIVGLYVKRNWPGPDSLTPYEISQLGKGALPPRRLGKVNVNQMQYEVAVREDAVVISQDRAGKKPLWRIPYGDISYLAVTPDWNNMLLMGGGGQLQLAFATGGQRRRYRSMYSIAQRVAAASGVQAEWWR